MEEQLEPKQPADIDAVIKRLEAARSVTAKGVEYWTARELQLILAYGDWKGFLNIVDKAKTACRLSGQEIERHFGQTTKLSRIGNDAPREIVDIFLTRYACYLIAMSGDTKKEEIATAQSYFARETRKQEKRAMEEKGLSRLELRNRAKDLNKQLGDAAKDSGVTKFGQFHNAGYRGLYDGLDVAAIKKQKKIPEKDNILDRMGNAELGINIFRITQAEEKLKEKGLIGEAHATRIHFEIGKKTRKAVEDIGGTMPEKLPAEPHIKEIEKQVNKEAKTLPPKETK